jgi:hypothetical protein
MWPTGREEWAPGLLLRHTLPGRGTGPFAARVDGTNAEITAVAGTPNPAW